MLLGPKTSLFKTLPPQLTALLDGVESKHSAVGRGLAVCLAAGSRVVSALGRELDEGAIGVDALDLASPAGVGTFVDAVVGETADSVVIPSWVGRDIPADLSKSALSKLTARRVLLVGSGLAVLKALAQLDALTESCVGVEADEGLLELDLSLV